MQGEQTFAVTMMRAGPALPYFEIGAYRYTADRLPAEGDIITIVPAATVGGGEAERLPAYVMRVDPASDTPIRVTEAGGRASSIDDYIVERDRTE